MASDRHPREVGLVLISLVAVAAGAGAAPASKFYEPRPGVPISPARLAALDKGGPRAGYYRRWLAHGDRIRLLMARPARAGAWIATYVDKDGEYNVVQPGFAIAIPPHGKDPIPGTPGAPPLLRFVRLQHARYVFGILPARFSPARLRLCNGRTLRRVVRRRGFWFRLPGLRARAMLTLAGPHATYRHIIS